MGRLLIWTGCGERGGAVPAGRTKEDGPHEAARRFRAKEAGSVYCDDDDDELASPDIGADELEELIAPVEESLDVADIDESAGALDSVVVVVVLLSVLVLGPHAAMLKAPAAKTAASVNFRIIRSPRPVSRPAR